MPMQGNTDAVLLASEYASRQRWRQPTTRSDLDRCAVRKSGKPERKQDVFASYNHTGATVVATLWLAIYAIAASQPFIAWSLSFFPQLR
jgi:hypothetical protein